MLQISRTGYADTRRASPTAGGYVEVFLKSVDKRVQFRGDEGITVELASGERLEIPAGAVLDKTGQRVPGLVTLELAAVNGRVGLKRARCRGTARRGARMARTVI